MEYNTQKKKLLLPEYGRNIQTMVEYIKTIKNKEDRTRLAHAVIGVMGNLYPNLRDVSDFRHKLWDHLMILADFDLDIDSPYPLPSRDILEEKPERLEYNTSHSIRFRYYGKSVEKLIQYIIDTDDPIKKESAIYYTAVHMKKSYIELNQDGVTDEHIFNDIKLLSNGRITIPEGMVIDLPEGQNSQQNRKKNKKNPKSNSASHNNVNNKNKNGNGDKNYPNGNNNNGNNNNNKNQYQKNNKMAFKKKVQPNNQKTNWK